MRGRTRNYKERDKDDRKEVVGNDHIPVCRTGVPVQMGTSCSKKEGRRGKGREERDRLIHSFR